MMNVAAFSLAGQHELAPAGQTRRRFPSWILELLALLPVMVWFIKRLNDGNEEPLGLLTLSAALMLAWRDRKSLGAQPAAATIGAGLILLSVLGIHGLPPMVRAGMALAGMVLFHGVHRHAGLTGLLFLSLPVTASMQFYLGYPLRVAAAEGTVRLLELASLTVERTGAQIELAGQVIGVDPACGGVRMLWHALAAAMVLAAIHRLSWRATVIAAGLAICSVIPANTLRVALLAVQETGHRLPFAPSHEAAGVLAFGLVMVPLWWAISSRARPAAPPVAIRPRDRTSKVLLGSGALLAPVLMVISPWTPAIAHAGPVPREFSFDGVTQRLHPLPASQEEMEFARGFPGTLSSHRWGDRQVILRQVYEATRRLHPSRDCLRAAGFETTDATTVTMGDGSRWARFTATRSGIRRTVYERIISTRNGSVWTDVSAWYWSALDRPLNGPWQAETVISE